jgi:hypothetical protein
MGHKHTIMSAAFVLPIRLPQAQSEPQRLPGPEVIRRGPGQVFLDRS